MTIFTEADHMSDCPVATKQLPGRSTLRHEDHNSWCRSFAAHEWHLAAIFQHGRVKPEVM
jgi:hypothetical protein